MSVKITSYKPAKSIVYLKRRAEWRRRLCLRELSRMERVLALAFCVKIPPTCHGLCGNPLQVHFFMCYFGSIKILSRHKQENTLTEFS